MGKIEFLLISLNKSLSGVYFSGETISGSVSLKVKERLKINFVVLDILGQGCVRVYARNKNLNNFEKFAFKVTNLLFLAQNVWDQATVRAQRHIMQARPISAIRPCLFRKRSMISTWSRVITHTRFRQYSLEILPQGKHIF
jgi:hypothetical protein